MGWMDALDGVGLEPAAPNCDECSRPPPAKKKKHAARRPARPLAPPGVSLAPEERARLEKERNREHARNTRARKKEALEKLRREVAGLEEAAVERDESERRARQIAKRRLAVLQCVFRKRGEGVLEREEWGKFLTSDFELRQPLNPHQACRPADVEGNRKLSRGVDGFIDDVASLSVLFRSVGRSADLSYRVAAAPTFACSVLPPAPTVVNDAVYGHWGARTTDARRHGARGEAGIRGLFCARFAESGCRLRSLELVYDVNALSEDIVRSTETPLTRVPGCLRDATFDADPAARVVTNRAQIKFCGASPARRRRHFTHWLISAQVTKATAPFQIVDCNRAWLELCSFPSKSSVVGRTLRVIQGPLTDRESLKRLHAEIIQGHATDATLLNYKGDGATFINYLRVCPIYPDRDPASKPSHYLGILRDLMADACADDARFGTESMACPLCGGTGRAPAAPAVYS